MRLSNVGEKSTPVSLKNLFHVYGKVKFVDLSETKECFIRFSTPEEASAAVTDLTQSKKDVHGVIPESVSLLSGDDEKQYWDKVSSLRQNPKKRATKYRKRY